MKKMNSIFSLHPKNFKRISIKEFIIHLKRIKQFYGEFVDNIAEEGLCYG